MDDVTEAERSRVISLLTRHCGDGRLTLDELEDRIGEVYAATTAEELRHALRELPPFRVTEHEPTAERRVEPAREHHREPAFERDEVIDLTPRRAGRPTPAGCGAGRPGVPCFFLVPLIVLLFVTAHFVLGAILLFFVVAKGPRERTFARV